jgi:UDP-N-acetylglucosamine/UDP-N-acetylgalactosamine diphosphorylase
LPLATWVALTFTLCYNNVIIILKDGVDLYMESRFEKAKHITDKFGQQHLLNYYNELSSVEQESLLTQILDINFELISSLYSDLVLDNKNENLYEDFSPLKAIVFENCSCEEKENYYKLGIEALKEGKVGALLVAGGQGTRLGHNGPKGSFNIGLPSKKSLFQLQCERLLNLSKKAERDIPWYIMTSPENHNDTIAFFKNNNYFGYKEEYIKFFKQGVMPSIDDEGKILFSTKSEISTSPSGNGGCFSSLETTGMLEEINNRGIQWLFLYGVDNALVRVVDPYFIGFTIKSGELAASKVVSKMNANEKVGVLCYKNGHPSIVEYTELSPEMMEQRDNDGNLIYDNANILNHVFHIDFITKILQMNLPFHVAHKKISYINELGDNVMPEKPNGYKFECFLFDIFSKLSGMAALKVKREDEFAPVKNSNGEDSPKTASDLILNMHKRWLINKGVDCNILNDKIVEVSPLTSYYGENTDVEKVIDKLLIDNIIEI